MFCRVLPQMRRFFWTTEWFRKYENKNVTEQLYSLRGNLVKVMLKLVSSLSGSNSSLMFVPGFSTARQSVFKFIKKSVIFVKKKLLIEFLYTILQKIKMCKRWRIFLLLVFTLTSFHHAHFVALPKTASLAALPPILVNGALICRWAHIVIVTWDERKSITFSYPLQCAVQI